MSTPSGAVYNRCRPVRLWNGLSSASRRRLVTTLCSKVCDLRAAGSYVASGWELTYRALGLVAIGVGAILVVPTLLFSQTASSTPSTAAPPAPTPAPPATAAQPAPTSNAHPEVVNLTLKGVKSVKRSDLLASIYTTASYCNSFILKPFCLISKSKYFYTRKYLDHQELQRDLLRVRVFYWKRGYRETEVDTAVVKRGSNKVGVTFFIKEGPPTLISDIAVDQPTPSLLSQREIGKRVVLSKNAPLNMIRVDSSRFFLQTSLFDKGYADAEVDTTIVLDSAARTAAVTFTLIPKYKTTVEDIVINGNDDVSSHTILKSLTFRVGDIFKRSEMLRSQRALYESNLFRRAAIEPRPPIDIATPDSAKVIVVTVQESPSREARVSAGFNTIDFFQLESRFTDYNFFGSARRLDVQGVVGNLFARSLNGRGIFRNASLAQTSSLARYFVPTYNASIDLTQPWFGSSHNTLGVSLFTHRRSAPGIYVDRRYGTSLTFFRELTERVPASINSRCEVSSVYAGGVYF